MEEVVVGCLPLLKGRVVSEVTTPRSRRFDLELTDEDPKASTAQRFLWIVHC